MFSTWIFCQEYRVINIPYFFELKTYCATTTNEWRFLKEENINQKITCSDCLFASCLKSSFSTKHQELNYVTTLVFPTYPIKLGTHISPFRKCLFCKSDHPITSHYTDIALIFYVDYHKQEENGQLPSYCILPVQYLPPIMTVSIISQGYLQILESELTNFFFVCFGVIWFDSNKSKIYVSVYYPIVWRGVWSLTTSFTWTKETEVY